jgi:hypothetical protein
MWACLSIDVDARSVRAQSGWLGRQAAACSLESITIVQLCLQCWWGRGMNAWNADAGPSADGPGLCRRRLHVSPRVPPQRSMCECARSMQGLVLGGRVAEAWCAAGCGNCEAGGEGGVAEDDSLAVWRVTCLVFGRRWNGCAWVNNNTRGAPAAGGSKRQSRRSGDATRGLRCEGRRWVDPLRSQAGYGGGWDGMRRRATRARCVDSFRAV